jgi:glutamate dehydrogenase/leucine dehydrogenase
LIADLLPAGVGEREARLDPGLEACAALEEAARRLDLEPLLLQRLRQPEREITVRLVQRSGAGPPASFAGYRVVHSAARGPASGGVHLRPDMTLSDLRAAAMLRTWQQALLGLPFGGAAGALVCDPQRLSERELKPLVKSYVTALRPALGPFLDVLSFGDGCNDAVMCWMAAGASDAVVTAMPAAGAGVCLLLPEAAGSRPLAGLRVALEGFGALGQAIAADLAAHGACLVAISDVSGGLRNDGGLPLAALRVHAARAGVLFGFSEAEPVSDTETLETPCDALVLADSERHVHARHAGRIAAPIVVEAAPGAVPPAAAEALSARGVLVIPNLLAGAGAALCDAMEWTRIVRGPWAASASVEEALRSCLLPAWTRVRTAAQRQRLTLREAATQLAVEAVAAALRAA